MLCACQAYEELSQSGACLEQKVQSNRLDGHTDEMRTVFMRDVFIVTEQHLVDAEGPWRPVCCRTTSQVLRPNRLKRQFSEPERS
jgi:hypothetical protein